ncbi:MAG: ribosome biogenesis GTPase YlqF [Provencibacterium sp.]|nr:ribosome biogenesis GTPase YlqF [Provencibacterium sp.]
MADNAPSIQWFPGHMAKTRRMISDSLKLTDAVIELLDARIPYASANPELSRLIKNKPRIVLLNKADSADPELTRAWLQAFEKQGVAALAADCRSGRGLERFSPTVRRALSGLLERRKARGMVGGGLRLMVVGIPNVGKSSLINRLAGSRRTKVEDRPGVTRGRQWVTLSDGMELLDTPGVLWPKFEDQQVAEHLAFVGSVKDDVLDLEALASRLLLLLARDYPQQLAARYRLDREKMEEAEGYELLGQVARARGMLLPGGVLNTERAAITVLDEFRGGSLGKISLERPEN